MTTKSIRGRVLWIDGFGNIITSIRRCDLDAIPAGSQLTISCRKHSTTELADHYAQCDESALIALFGSSDHLELAVVDGDASERIELLICHNSPLF